MRMWMRIQMRNNTIQFGTLNNHTEFKIEIQNIAFTERNWGIEEEKTRKNVGVFLLESNSGRKMCSPSHLFIEFHRNHISIHEIQIFEFISTTKHEKSNKMTLILSHKSHLSFNNEKYVQDTTMHTIFFDGEKRVEKKTYDKTNMFSVPDFMFSMNSLA